MPKKPQRHTQLKRWAAGPTGTTEKPQRGGTRLDARRPKQAIEVERSGRLEAALRRLGKEKGVQRVLQVPQRDFDRAIEAAQQAGVGVTVANLSGIRKRSLKGK